MRTIASQDVVAATKRLCIEANTCLGRDLLEGLRAAASAGPGPQGMIGKGFRSRRPCGRA